MNAPNELGNLHLLKSVLQYLDEQKGGQNFLISIKTLSQISLLKCKEQTKKVIILHCGHYTTKAS